MAVHGLITEWFGQSRHVVPPFEREPPFNLCRPLHDVATTIAGADFETNLARGECLNAGKLLEHDLCRGSSRQRHKCFVQSLNFLAIEVV